MYLYCRYWGPWTRAETTFSNEYYRLLLEESWTVKTTHEGKPWTGPVQFESKDGALMMLPADIALVQVIQLVDKIIIFTYLIS